MSDNSYARVLFYGVPSGQVEAALDALDGEGFSQEFDNGPARGWQCRPNRPAVIELGESYDREGAHLDASADLAAALAEVAPGAVFATWSDPADGELGVLRIHVPGLGMF